MSRSLKEHDTWEGVRVSVDVDKYDTLEIWTRGRTTASVSWSVWLKQKLRSPFRPQRQEAEKHTRIFVGVRSKGEKKLHLKVFKDVPSNMLEYLLPDGKILMSKFDKSFGIECALGCNCHSVLVCRHTEQSQARLHGHGWGLAWLV